MKLKLIGVILFSLICWAYPISTAAQSKLNTQTKTEQVTSPNNALPPQTNEVPASPNQTQSSQNRTPRNDLSGQGFSGRHYSKEEVQQLIRDYSAQYGIPAEVPLCIARLESGFRWDARNPNSSASGVMQYLSSTWAATDEGKAGHSVFNAEQNIKAAIKYMASRKNTNPWVVGPTACPEIRRK